MPSFPFKGSRIYILDPHCSRWLLMSDSVSKRRIPKLIPALVAGALSLMAGWFLLPAQEQAPAAQPVPAKVQPATPAPAIERGQTIDESQRRSSGCVSCHGPTDSPSMHT